MIYQHLLNRVAKLTLGNSALKSIIAQDGTLTLNKYFHHRLHIKKLNREFRKSEMHLESAYPSCIKQIAPVTSPLALISQVQRSGGTLLSQLFDGHPELHAHPHEMKIGYPTKDTWPQLDLNENPARWLEILFEYNVLNHLRKGYKKEKKQDEAFLLLLLPSVQREIFMDNLGSVKSPTLRDIFNAYMTSYFGAWLNNQNSFGHKKFITAFTPRLAMSKKNMESFFEIYPDGRLKNQGRTVSYTAAPSQIPACGTTAPGSSNLLTYALTTLHKEFQLLTWVLFSNLRSRHQKLVQQVFESSPVEKAWGQTLICD